MSFIDFFFFVSEAKLHCKYFDELTRRKSDLMISIVKVIEGRTSEHTGGVGGVVCLCKCLTDNEGMPYH
jgi:hypothetical protein